MIEISHLDNQEFTRPLGILGSVGRFCRSPAPPASPWPHIDPGRLEVSAGGLSPHTGGLLNPPQRPAQPSQCKNLLSFFVAQYVAHAAGGYKASRRRQRPLATFLIGRF